ncbi:hypothetical protein EDB81DRAFT_813842 [Dactylonectria macrodidyma]|uniref:GH64 domain-containing protein n=1 Tax=Dactylonectria macrodidyma TaxID=307937 RepID=A0A9P9DLF7_9HYPO|nr:hypothetical protein EDB81DRAFT_813842 [Dactylonectria macrodidyma]
MRPFFFIAALFGVASCHPTFRLARRSLTPEGFTKIHPGGIDDVVVTEDNTLNSTTFENSTSTIARRDPVGATLPLKFVNNHNGNAVNAYISGLDSNGAVVFVAADGSLIYPSSGGSTVPVQITDNIAIPITSAGETLEFTLPIEMSSGRIYFSEGELSFYMVNIGVGDGLVQPSVTNLQDASAGLNWGFVEFTYTGGVLYANISYVDFVGMILGMFLSVSGGSSTQSAAGLQADSVANICNALVTQKDADGFPWSSMCLANSAGTPIRVLSPGNFHELNADAFASYWTSYVDQVWSQYTTTPLTINTQMDSGDVSCQVSGDELVCNGDNRGYAKPAANDIWGCNTGPFAILDGDNAIHKAVVPRLCAAFVRSTLLLDGGNVQPSLGSDSYYTVDPTNHYSRVIHEYEVDGRGYAFPYDDVNPDGNENASGTVSSANVDSLTIYVGAPPSA